MADLLESECYMAVREHQAGAWHYDYSLWGYTREDVQSRINALNPEIRQWYDRSEGPVVDIVRVRISATLPQRLGELERDVQALEAGIAQANRVLAQLEARTQPTPLQVAFAGRDIPGHVAAEYGLADATVRDAMNGGSNG